VLLFFRGGCGLDLEEHFIMFSAHWIDGSFFLYRVLGLSFLLGHLAFYRVFCP
jgi:hypothetical protein